jgi:ATP/maltotriose-dependent transcriptional regulator MalT
VKVKLPVCTKDPDLWFSTDKADVALAKELCQPCPMKRECRGMGRLEEFGIWGGEQALGEVSREEVRLEDQASEILRLTHEGLSARVIAERLNVSGRTVVRVRTAARNAA